MHEETERAGKNVLLLAEDDADMREYLVDSLSSEYKVVAVPDGGKALETAREINPRYHYLGHCDAGTGR
ncbi:hypothetical protein NIB75_27270 [Bacteroides uniformis]|nr:hypothetical protein [Bacteroides uniformis]